ncbi:MAG: radical SAM protein [bacterium]|nr:radical SAM protein [bacterium]
MNFKTLLFYPPAADFTQPYPAIPYLAGFLRDKGEDVFIKDLNIAGHEYILKDQFLEKCLRKVEKRFAFLDKKKTLDFNQQKEYLKCLEALGVNPEVTEPGTSGGFLHGFGKKEKFYDFKEYSENTGFFKQALTLISAAYFPTQLNPAEYTTPFFLSSRDDIIEQTIRAFNPFIEFYENTVIPLIEKENPALIGLSVTYPGQVLQMFALAHLIKKKFPGIHICAGGAFISRLVLNMPPQKCKTFLNYLDSIILYEGETALHKLILHLKENEGKPVAPLDIPNLIYYDRVRKNAVFPQGEPFLENLDELPPPDFNGYPLDQYLSPTMVLPYAPTRGCYWNKCAFCHYGATKEGTAKYRERSLKKVVDDMEFLAADCKVDHFAFSIDVMSPAMAIGLADELIKRKRPYKWNSELKIEKIFTPEICKKLKQGGCLSIATGLESGCLRILKLIDKGFTPETAGEVIRNFSEAGISVQVMAFMDFPTESTGEALETIRLISENQAHISLFTLGDFELLPGSGVFKEPDAYGIKDVHYAKWDEFKLLCLYKEKIARDAGSKTQYTDTAYVTVAEKYAGLEFPFAGAVSTNHTFLYFERFGKDIFKAPELLKTPGDAETEKSPDMFSRPKLGPSVKVLEGNFSMQELNENLEKNSALLKTEMDKSGQSYRKALKKILDKSRVSASQSVLILVEDMKWTELPGHVKEILDLCNGENTYNEITGSKGPMDKEFIEMVLKGLLSLDIVTL